MIRYDLRCAAGHAFDSWFQSATAYDSLAGRALIACPLCGSTGVTKSLMAPAVRPARNADAARPGNGDAPADRPLSTPGTDLELALAALRRQVEENSDYVGMNFAAEARRIHDGEVPERAIHGEARPDEARRLIEDGIPVAPLPFLPARKTN
ncbi:DUF1178 family protein [Paracoccaceae bacterium Fryx2]|nr:DUF1178 family protein [Paracoccaceae bacterium Fryx2]